MSVTVVRLGSPRLPKEGLRIGTVRRPPRGVSKDQFAALDYYDVWFPNLSPSGELMAWAKAEAWTEKRWQAFVRRFRAEMAAPDNRRTLDVVAALSQHSDFSVGCYCADEQRCHRSVLRELLRERNAKIV